MENLEALASDPARPCVFSDLGVLTPFTPATCTPVIRNNPTTFNLFDAWANPRGAGGSNAVRAAIVRGQVLFNAVDLHVGGAVEHCVTCHSTNNIGNNPSATFFVRLGVDSVDILTTLAAEDSRVLPLLERVSNLPVYCLRPTSDPSPFSTSPCGNDPDDRMTTDPGRAMVTGNIANVGAFKPPILRGLPVRAPFFHNGAAETIEDLIHFYNARFQIGLTDQQVSDLAAFLKAL